MWNEAVAMIGVGTMGRGMALTLAAHGVRVQAWNRSVGALDELRDARKDWTLAADAGSVRLPRRPLRHPDRL